MLITELDGLRLTISKWPHPRQEEQIVWVDGERMPREPGAISPVPFIATLEARFSDAELEALAAQYTREPVNLGGFLALHRFVEGEDLVRMLEVLHASPVPDARRWLELARLDKRAGDTQAAVRSARIASTLARVDMETSVGDQARKLAAELDASTPENPGHPTYSELVAAGFQPLVPGEDAVVVSLAPGGRARFVVDHGEKVPIALTVSFRSARDERPLGFDLWTDHTKASMTRPIGQPWTSIFEGPRIKVESELRDGHVELRAKI